MHNIIDTAVAAGNFKTLAAALTAAGLVETLKGTGPFTVFAPTDEAFAKLPAGTVTMVRIRGERGRFFQMQAGAYTKASQADSLLSALRGSGSHHGRRHRRIGDRVG